MGTDWSTKFISLDVHKNTISLAVAKSGADEEVRLYGTIRNTLEAIDKVIRKLISTGDQLKFVYEAGPCGFVLIGTLKKVDITEKCKRCVARSVKDVPLEDRDRINLLLIRRWDALCHLTSSDISVERYRLVANVNFIPWVGLP